MWQIKVYELTQIVLYMHIAFTEPAAL